MDEAGADARLLLAAKLKELIEVAGLPYKTIVSRVARYRPRGAKREVTAQRISSWKRGENVPATWQSLADVVRTLIEQVRGRSTPPAVTDDLLDMASWHKLWTAASASPPRSPAPTRVTVRECDPAEMEARPAALPTEIVAANGATPGLTAYLLREHDDLLRNEIKRAVGGSSVFAILAGDAATGKKRAVYEALMAEVPDWLILKPRGGHELLQMLKELKARTVLHLNELQEFLGGESGARVSVELARALAAATGLVALGTIWSKPYLAELTYRGRSPDVHASARRLLEQARIITVPSRMGPAEQRALAALAGEDQRVKCALAAGSSSGRVIQHLAGGPELVCRYVAGDHFTVVERALISAALDARCHGYRGPLTAELLAAIADGFLHPQQRPGNPDWAQNALDELAAGERLNGSRSDVRNTLTALVAVRARSGGTEVSYELNDYLERNAHAVGALIRNNISA